MQADATNVFLNSVKECAPTILEKNSFPLLEFKKPVYNEELTDEIAKLLRNPLTPIFATRPTPKAGENLHNHQAGDNLHNHQSTTNSITRKPANRSYILISPIPGREDHKPAAVKWSLPELNIKLSADSVTEEDTVNVQQQNPELDSQEEDFDSIFVDIVGSIPEYYKHEIAPTHEKIQQLKEAVDYWIEKADTRRDMMQTAIESRGTACTQIK